MTKRHLAIFLLAALVVGVPIYYTLAGTASLLTPRLDYEGLSRDYWLSLLFSPGNGALIAAHLKHIAYTFLVYVHYVETSLFYGGESPLLTLWLAPAFLLGMAYSLRRWRARGPLLILLWVVITSLGNSLLELPTEAPRYVVVFPALALAAAVGIRFTLPLIVPRRFAFRAAFGLAAALALWQAFYYFGPHLDVYNRQLRLYRDGQDAIYRSLDFPQGTGVHVIGVVVLYDFDVAQMLHYFGRDDLLVDIRTQPPTPEQIASLPRDRDHAFYVEPEDTRTVELLRQTFDLEPPQYSPFNVPADRQLVLYYASAR